MIRKTAIVISLLAVLPPGPASALDQDLVDLLRESFRRSAERSDLGNAFQSLTIFGATPGISAATFNVSEGGDALDLDSIKFSPSHTFDPVLGVKPYVEATLGYLDTGQRLDFTLSGEGPTRAKVDVDTFTILGGAGLEFGVAEGTALRPILLVGYSHISDDARASGPFAEELLAAGKGIVFDARIESLLIGGALELQHTRSFEGDINLDGTIRYNHIFDTVLDASDPVLESNGDFGVFTANAELDGPLGVSVFGRELRWIGFASNTWLPGEQNDALGFSFFFELGGGIELVDRDVVSGIEGVSLRGSGIVGDGVTGWTVGLSVEF